MFEEPKMPQSQGVTKLKEILFENEARALTDLQRRIEAVAKVGTDQRAALARDLNKLAIDEAKFRTEFKSQLNSVFDRAGTEERFKASVAEVIDRALNQAEVDRHEQLSDAIAPLVVRTIKREINESQDELVEALYPITGRLVQAYVASAIRDLTDRINAQLSANPTMLRVKSMMTGRSVAELALAQSQTLKVEEVYLIRRGSGELLAHWPDVQNNVERDQLMSGILTAINEFSLEAFNDDTSSLRRIDLNTSHVYLRASPLYLLAARCSGYSNAATEQLIDEEFLASHERRQPDFEELATRGPTAGQRHGTLLAETAERIESRVEEMRRSVENDNTGWYILKGLGWLIGLLVVGWISWSTYKYATTEWVRERANAVISETQSMRGYPVRLTVADYGTEISLAGLAPSSSAKEEIITNLKDKLGNTVVNDDLTVVATSPDTTPQIKGLREDFDSLKRRLEREAFERSAERTLHRLDGIPTDLRHLNESLKGESAHEMVAEADKMVADVRANLAELVKKDESRQASNKDLSAQLAAMRLQIARTAAKLAILLDPAAAHLRPEPEQTQGAGTNTLIAEAEAMAVQTEQFATLAVALAQAASVKPAPAAEPTPREKLAAWIRDHAIFFSNGTRFRNPVLASQHFDQLAGLIKEAKQPVRIVGFTDEKGGSQQNSTLSKDRAEIVKRALQSRGVDDELLIPIGRLDAKDISNDIGESSPNRRVEFELGFVGELR